MALIPSSALLLRRNSVPEVLGNGVQYPFLESSVGGFRLEAGVPLIRQSVILIIETGIYERPFQVRNGVPFGTRIPYLHFENAEKVRDLATYDIERALSVWEPRIVLRHVVLVSPITGSDPRSIEIHVVYKIRASGEEDTAMANVRRLT